MSGRDPDFVAARLAFVAGTASADATEFSCALCGCRFTHAGLACGCCPLKAGCDVVVCPHCGFQFPRTSRAVEWARRLLRRRRLAPRRHSPAADAGPAPAEAHRDEDVGAWAPTKRSRT